MSTNVAFLLLTLFASSCAVVQDDAKNRPVSKVINLLKSMISELEAEAEEDEDVYETMGCWCETNDKIKTKSIADAEQKISDLTSAIESFTGSSARLNVEIANLEKEISKNSMALDQATALRKKELADFNAEEKELLQTISSLKSAVIALSKHHEALIQEDTASATSATTMQQIQIDVTVQHVLQKHKDLLTPHQRRVAKAFMQHKQSYAPASSEIFGMLKQMKETFETNLANSQKADAESQKEFEDMKAAKESEIKAGTELADTKSTELASTDEKLAQSKESLEDTRDILAADTAFLADLKERCENMDQEYEERTKTRQLEITATSGALAYLNSDEAHDLFTKTFNFVQVGSTANGKSMKRRAQAAKVLAHAAKKYQDPRLSTLAVKARMDTFAKVKKSIQDMIDKLLKEKKDEIKHKDFCIEEININERDTEMKERDRADIEAKIDDLTMKIDALAKEIEVLKAEVAELQVQMKRAGEDREKQNKEFQTVVADQRATQKLLEVSLGILKGFYEKAALVQKGSSVSVQASGQAPPPGFKSYEKNKKSGGVMGMMQGIIDDAKTMEAESIRGEEDSQKAYEAFIMDTNNSIEEKTKAIVSKSDMKAKAEGEKVEAETEHEGIMENLESLTNENTDLHKACDFTVKNFEIRQTARDDEIDALREGLATFSGASFMQFLEKE